MPGAGFPYIKDIPDDIEVIYFPEEHRADGLHGAGIGEPLLPAPMPRSSTPFTTPAT